MRNEINLEDMIFNQGFIKNRMQLVRLFVVLLGFMWSNLGMSQVNFYFTEELPGNSAFGPNKIELSAIVDCSGPVTFKFNSTLRIRNIKLSYDSGPFISIHSQGIIIYSEISSSSNPTPHTAYDFPKNTIYLWYKSFPDFNASTSIEFTFEYQNGFGNWNPEGATLNYGRIGDTPPFVVDFLETEISTNNYSYTYTGTDPSTIPNTISFLYTFDNGQGTITGTGNSSLIPGELIGGVAENPTFYCRANTFSTNLLTIKPKLVMKPIYGLVGHVNSFIVTNFIQCPYPIEKPIILQDLCPLFTDFEVNNIPPNEFSSEVSSSSSGDAILDGMVDGISISVNGNGFSGSVTGITGTDQTSNFGFPLAQYQNYNLTETITIESGCVCQNTTNYNTANPCYNLIPMTTSFEFVNGEYVYTFVLSDYSGGAIGVNVTGVEMDFGDGTFGSFLPGQTITHVYPDDANYTATQTVQFNNGQFPPCSTTHSFGAETYCCINFAPESGNDAGYWLSAWVKEDHPNQQKTYQSAYIELSFGGGNIVELYPSGDIVEGWQRIVGKFSVPPTATSMSIDLVNTNGSIDAYFDDIRVHPFNSSMKSYVYDPETLWLTAELDDNNYATFYEYDKEGQLIRIKKETARGIMTIQESRSSNPKSE